MEELIGVYIITNNENGKKYIGASNNVLRRFIEHRCPRNLKKNNILYKAFKKYGLSSFDFILLDWLDDIKKLPQREKFWIKKLKPEYNMNEGGLGNVGLTVSEETRKKLSLISKNQWDELSAEDKVKRIKNNLTGPVKGHIVYESTRKKLRDFNLGKKQSKETILKRSKALKETGRKLGFCVKKVGAFKYGKLYKKFDSVKSAAGFINVHPSCITGVLKGRRITSGGYKWKYLNK